MDTENVSLQRSRIQGRAILPPTGVPTTELVGQVANTVKELARKEIELAKTELRDDLRREVVMAGGLGIAGICALITLTLLCVAAVFALATVMPGWGAALVVAAAVLLAGTIAGLVGWGKRVTSPLAVTRRSLKEHVRWAKERIA